MFYERADGAELFTGGVEFLLAALDDAVAPQFRPDGLEFFAVESGDFVAGHVREKSTDVINFGGVVLAADELGEGHAVLAAHHEDFDICGSSGECRGFAGCAVAQEEDAAG